MGSDGACPRTSSHRAPGAPPWTNCPGSACTHLLLHGPSLHGRGLLLVSHRGPSLCVCCCCYHRCCCCCSCTTPWGSLDSTRGARARAKIRRKGALSFGSFHQQMCGLMQRARRCSVFFDLPWGRTDSSDLDEQKRAKASEQIRAVHTTTPKVSRRFALVLAAPRCCGDACLGRPLCAPSSAARSEQQQAALRAQGQLTTYSLKGGAAPWGTSRWRRCVRRQRGAGARAAQRGAALARRCQHEAMCASALRMDVPPLALATGDAADALPHQDGAFRDVPGAGVRH